MKIPQILIVEDELVTRNMLKSIFEGEGYQVFQASNGEEMHSVLSTNEINLVLMDINLPGKKWINSRPRNSREYEATINVFNRSRQ